MHWRYGKIVVRAKLPAGQGLWPAIWMMPNDDAYGTWAASGEIDIMEAQGERADRVSSALHYGGVWPHHDHITSGLRQPGCGNAVVPAVDYSRDFHEYAVDWNRDNMVFSVDGVETWNVNLDRMWHSRKSGAPRPYTKPRQPFDQSFYLILNLAVGGNFVQDPTESTVWSANELVIDHVRVYQRSGDETAACPP
eukprot:UC1_evm1s870